MRGFAFLVALLGGFAYLLIHFSFWAAFGGMYMVGMIVVALIATFGRRQGQVPLAWDDSSEPDQV